MQQTTGWIKYRSAFVTSDETAPSLVSANAPSNLIVTEGWDGIRCRFLCGADAQTIVANVYIIDASNTVVGANQDPAEYHATTIGAAACTGGTLTGVDGGQTTASEFFVDTLAWSASKLHDDLALYMTAARPMDALDYSPTSNEVAELLLRLPQGIHGIVVTFTGLSSESANMLYKLDRLNG